MLKKILLISICLLVGFFTFSLLSRRSPQEIPNVVGKVMDNLSINPLQISYMRSQNYPGSNLKIEQTLAPGSNYHRYIASYYSQNLKIYGLLTVPDGNSPPGGFPAIIFNHGYITPKLYTPDGNYVAYVNVFAERGYIVFKPDYRGHWQSGGIPGSEYFSRNYDIDDLNAITTIKNYEKVNPNKIGVWGHSLGGHITLMDLVISNDIKVAVIWGGVVGSYNDIIYNWQNRVSYQPDKEDLRLRNQFRDNWIMVYKTPTENPSFWDTIDPTQNLNFVNAPVQVHVGLADSQVPSDFSSSLVAKLKAAGKYVEFYQYKGAGHNISESFAFAMERSISFFDRYLK